MARNLERSSVLTGRAAGYPPQPQPYSPFQRIAARGMIAGGIVLALGTLVDLGVLWILQRQETPQWEYVAIANTLEAFPRLVLALGFFYLVLYVGRSESLAAYRFVAAGLVVLGIFGMALGAIMATSYLILARLAQPEAMPMLQSIALKSIALSFVYTAVLLPIGILGLRRPKV